MAPLSPLSLFLDIYQENVCIFGENVCKNGKNVCIFAGNKSKCFRKEAKESKKSKCFPKKAKKANAFCNKTRGNI